MNTPNTSAIRRPGAVLRPVCSTLIGAALALGLAGAAQAQRPRDVPPPGPEAAELQRQRSNRLDEVYLRPGAKLGAYTRLKLAPVDVAFSKYWARQHPDLPAADGQKLREEMVELANRTFREELPRGKGGYPVVDQAGADVLELRVSVIDLDINAPEINDAALRRTYVLSAGEGTLVAELRDSQTGTLLARVVDRREMLRHMDLQIANSVTNSAEVRQMLTAWVRALRRQIDAAKAASETP
jgi:Protein of unknown function (DUF3313)